LGGSNESHNMSPAALNEYQEMMLLHFEVMNGLSCTNTAFLRKAFRSITRAATRVTSRIASQVKSVAAKVTTVAKSVGKQVAAAAKTVAAATVSVANSVGKALQSLLPVMGHITIKMADFGKIFDKLASNPIYKMVTGLLDKAMNVILQPILKALHIPDPCAWIPSFDFGVRDFADSLKAKMDEMTGGLISKIAGGFTSDQMFDMVMAQLVNMPAGCDSTLLRKTQEDLKEFKVVMIEKPKAIKDAVVGSLKSFEPETIQGCQK